MKFIIDSSVAFKWMVAEVNSQNALHLLNDQANGVHELLAPDLFPTEVANALASAEKSRRIQAGEAATFFLHLVNNAPILIEATPLLARGLDMCLATRHSVYDCLYVALAEREGCEFVTADDKVVKNLQSQFSFIRHLSTMP